MALYQVALLGEADANVRRQLTSTLLEMVEPLGIKHEIEVTLSPTPFKPKNDYASVALFFGALGLTADEVMLHSLMRQGTPVIPIVPDLRAFSTLVPKCLHAINGLELDASDTKLLRLATLALEVLGLLHRQRRVFLSYKRTESRDAALQLYEYLAGLHFDLFLDTHGLLPGDDFQEVLWHRLSDCDVLVMLDTPSYFESRWTSQEYGRALAKSLEPLRLGWPGVPPSPRTMAAESLQLQAADFEAGGKLFTAATLKRVALAVERVRSRGIALRSAEMNGAIILAVEKVDGRFLALGPKRTIVIELVSGHRILVFPSVGVPNAQHLYEVSMLDWKTDSRAVVFDDAGLEQRWQAQLEWLGTQVRTARWLKMARAAWEFAAWG